MASPMPASLAALLARLIDYAGLFPPASLDLETAIVAYARDRAGPDAWMLGRFVIPAARLPELDPYVALFPPSAPLEVVALGRRAADDVALGQALRADLGAIEMLRARHGDRVRVEVLEQPLPPESSSAARLVAAVAHACGLRAFCEPSVALGPGWLADTERALDQIVAESDGARLAVKLRTGGTSADAFPTPEQLAGAIAACRSRGLALKFTAGLHHPLRMYRAEVGAHMHGFLNVFVAGMLAHTHGLHAAALAEILADEQPGSFQFDEQGIAWRGNLITPPEIARLRAAALIAFGSCSFDEPRDDMRRLGMLGGKDDPHVS